MKTYTFQVVIEPDEDRWRAYSPELEEYGGATWGYTRADAEKNIREVLVMVLEDMIEENDPIPETAADKSLATEDNLVAVTVGISSAGSRRR